jgi:erythromycin esterase-like protein
MPVLELSPASQAEELDGLARRIRTLITPLEGPPDLDPLQERIGDARCVLLGEASHGTSEYYTWRALISRQLIQENGFSFIAVEGDWPDCYRVNRYVKGEGDAGCSARQLLHAFDRWPTWMWANEEMVQFVEWLRRYNEERAADAKVGFYGLDVYSLWDSLHAVIQFLEHVDLEDVPAARRAFRCFEPFGEDLQDYGWSTMLVPHTCEEPVVALLAALRRKASAYCAAPLPDAREAYFNAEQNALVARHAEQYYRTMVRGGPISWNVRDHHMADTLDRLLWHYGPRAKAIVWAHNTHVGDARATDMAAARMTNIGQLARERHGLEDVVLVGFGSHHGTVIAGRSWGAPMECLTVPPAETGSYEDAFRRASAHNQLLIMPEGTEAELLRHWHGHRAIGVVYNPENERFGNYVPTSLAARYDAFLYLDRTHALHPLHLKPHVGHDLPETFPSGV